VPTPQAPQAADEFIPLPVEYAPAPHSEQLAAALAPTPVQ